MRRQQAVTIMFRQSTQRTCGQTDGRVNGQPAKTLQGRGLKLHSTQPSLCAVAATADSVWMLCAALSGAQR